MSLIDFLIELGSWCGAAGSQKDLKSKKAAREKEKKQTNQTRTQFQTQENETFKEEEESEKKKTLKDIGRPTIYNTNSNVCRCRVTVLVIRSGQTLQTLTVSARKRSQHIEDYKKCYAHLKDARSDETVAVKFFFSHRRVKKNKHIVTILKSGALKEIFLYSQPKLLSSVKKKIRKDI